MPHPAKDYADLLLRILRKITITNSGCWDWCGSKTKQGYGSINYNQKKVAVHRIMAHIKIGDVADKDVVCHRCDNPGCVNPEHLFIGTQRDNYYDMVGKDRRNLVFGERQGSAKLTAEKVKAIRLDSRAYKLIAEDYGITKSHVGNLKANRAWRHV